MTDNGGMTLNVSEVVYREDLYPRLETKPALVQQYAKNIELLPPIEVNQHNILIDGYHRWTAHKKQELDTIQVEVTRTESEAQLFALAVRRNAAHDEGLNDADKQNIAIRLYEAGNGLSKEELANVLLVTERTVRTYLDDIDKQRNKQRKKKIQEMYLACYTDEEIGEAVDRSQQSITKENATFTTFGNVSKSSESLAFFSETETNPKGETVSAFKIPRYNVWTFAKKTNEVAHHGNSEQRILDNLLYLYTQPFDIVIDPFAGGGSTIDICIKRLRRYWVSDRKPIVERANEIRELDITQGLPPLAKRWSDVTLTYLDPPYWKQAENKYSEDPEDLANMSLEDFTKATVGVIKQFASKQSKGIIALLMQPTQWNADNKQFTDHIIDIIKGVNTKKLTLHNRVSCPYSTQQYNDKQSTWAKENKELLVLTRELIIWKVG